MALRIATRRRCVPRGLGRDGSYIGADHMALNEGSTLPEITMPAALRAAALANHVNISASNSSAPWSCWPAFFVRADGVVTGRLERHQAGILVSTVHPTGNL